MPRELLINYLTDMEKRFVLLQAGKSYGKAHGISIAWIY